MDIIKLIDDNRAREYRITKQSRYFEGLNPGIFKDRPKERPDNRVPIPIARRAVKLVQGYMAKPGSIVYSGDFYENTLKDIFNTDEEDLQTSELLEDCLKHGMGFELHYTLDGVPHFATIPQANGIPIYDTSIKPRLIAFLYYYTDESEKMDNAILYTESEIIMYQRKKGVGNYSQTATMLHGYGRVPVIVYTISRDKSNLFDHCQPLLDWLDKIVSEDFANELERFAQAYLLLANRLNPEQDPDTGETDLDRLKRTRVFEDLQENVQNQVAFLTKNVNDAFINSAADRAERLIYEALMIFNPNDPQFLSETSGVAMAYKLLGFEYLCTGIETYFSKGLQTRVRMIARVLRSLGRSVEDETEVYISFKRNLPFNLSELADQAMKLKGILSDETILKLFPTTIVNDVEEEMERLEKEKSDEPDFETVPETTQTQGDDLEDENGQDSST